MNRSFSATGDSCRDSARKKRVFWRCAALLAALWFAVLLGGSARAAAASETVVRIGFPTQPGVSYIDEQGHYAGYLVDYLHQLEMFTNWEIEFVQVEGDLNTQLSTLMELLMQGEIDILGTMNRSEQLEQLFLYPSYSYGTTYTVLAVREDDLQWIEEDFSHWDNIRVATYPGYEARAKEFGYFANANNFSYQLVECASYHDMIEAVRNGEADAMIQADISLTDGFRVIGRFSPVPYYFALTQGKTELLQQLDAAMRSLNTAQPYLQMELYDLHFCRTEKFQISPENREFLQSLGTLKVLFFDGNAPYQYRKEGQLTGFIVEYWDRFADLAGLSYEPVVAETYAEAFSLVKSGQVDLVACVATNSTLSSLENVQFTLPYFNSFSVSAGAENLSETPPADLEFKINTELTLEQILKGEESAVQLDYYSLSFYLRKETLYDPVEIDWSNTKNFSYVFGVTRDFSDSFLAILNQYISSVKAESTQALLSHYSGDTIQYTRWEWLMIHRVFILAAAVVLCVLGVLLWFVMHSRRLKYKALLAENRLMQLAMYDPLTGACNETYFRKLLQESCLREEPAALVAFNIRGFKYINDTYGIPRANELLRGIAATLKPRLKEGEFLCRSTADLFYLLLQESSAETLLPRMDSLFGQISLLFSSLLGSQPLSLYSGAVFVARSPAPFNVAVNLNYMMAALAHAKVSKSESVYLFDDALYQAEQLDYYIEGHQQSALDKQEFQLYLQPKKNFRTGRIDSAEALVRWQTQDRGMIYPNQFIPLFEENGFCAKLDLYMVEQVCRTLRSWMDAGIAPIAISVNQTKPLFVKGDYVERLLAITQKYRVPPCYIILEILEGLAFENLDALNQTIRRLNEAGFQVSMDDFGSGFSSLNTLGKLEINELKLDRGFLKDVVSDPESSEREVLDSILTLARKLGIRTVAEGVETPEGDVLLQSMACDYGQGFYYSRPIPAEEFRKTFCSPADPSCAAL